MLHCLYRRRTQVTTFRFCTVGSMPPHLLSGLLHRAHSRAVTGTHASNGVARVLESGWQHLVSVYWYVVVTG